MSAMTFRERKDRNGVTLSITPLIDVLFLLIIFFMLTGTFKRLGELELRLPGSSTSVPTPEEQEAHQVELVVTEDGRLILEGSELELSQLKRQLSAVLRSDPQSRVLIKAEESVEHGRIVLLLDIVRDSGFKGVGIGTYIEIPSDAGP